MEDYFRPESIHCEGKCFLDIDAQGNLYTVGPDDVIFHKNLTTGESDRADYDSTSSSSLESIAAHPTEVGTIAVARDNFVGLARNRDASNLQEVYTPKGKVNWLAFSTSGNLLAIGCQEHFMVVYNLSKQKAVKCRPGHSNSVLSVMFSPDEKYVCSISLDGTLKIYKFDAQLDPQLFSTLQICAPSEVPSDLVAAFNPESTVIAVPGKPVLELMESEEFSFRPKQQQKIKHDKPITICFWFSSHVLITGGLDNTVALWNMTKTERITYVPACLPRILKRFDSTFYGIDKTGTYLEFTRLELLVVKVEVVAPALQVHSDLEEANPFEDLPADAQQQQPKPLLTKPDPKKELKPVDRLITCLPQSELTTACEMQGTSRYLLYNQTGYLVQFETNIKVVEVQYHDKTIFCRKKRIITDKEVRSVALFGRCVAYCTKSEMGFVGELDWEFETEEISEVALGANWVAGLSDQDVYIFDFAGNCTNRIAIDRQNVAMRGYEDMLVMVYHDSVPMEGSQSLRMRIYNMTGRNVGIREQVSVPITRSSTLKTFGISGKGMIYSEDSLNRIRVYQLGRGQWTLIVDPTADEEPAKLTPWIIDIDGPNLIAFLLPEGQNEPTVASQLAPRNIKISMEGLSKNDKKLGQLLWTACWLQHEKYRNTAWYKYKYSRSKDNQFYSISNSILSDPELKAKEMELESELMKVVGKMVTSGQQKKAMHFCQQYVQHNKSVALSIFEETPGCASLAARLREYYREQEEDQLYLAELNKKAFALNLNLRLEVEVSLLGFGVRQNQVDPLLPQKKKLRQQALLEKLEYEMAQLVPSE